jgi:hypothetical protein
MINTHLSVLVILVIAINPMFSQESSTEKDVFVLLEKYADALSKKDPEQAAAFFLSDSFFKYVSDGFVVTKEDWIKYQSESWKRMNYYSFKWTEREIKSIGENSALAVCKANRNIRFINGPMRVEKLIFTITLERIKDQWLITSIHESPSDVANEASK